MKNCDISVLYHPSEANVVADALSSLSMVRVAHIEDKKKELVFEVHRLFQLGVQLVDSTKGSFTVHNDSESSFIIDVKSNKDLDPILVELKESVVNKSIKTFSYRGYGVRRY